MFSQQGALKETTFHDILRDVKAGAILTKSYQFLVVAVRNLNGDAFQHSTIKPKPKKRRRQKAKNSKKPIKARKEKRKRLSVTQPRKTHLSNLIGKETGARFRP